MKINPLDKIQSPPPASTDKSGKITQEGDFAEALKKAVQNSASCKSVSTQPLQGLLRPPLADSQREEGIVKVHSMLDALERYQKHLIDPKANLRRIQSDVAQLKSHVEMLEPMLKRTAGEEGLRQVINEALIVASKEIGRFERGDYVD